MAEERISVHICSNKCRCLREIKEGYSIVNGLSNGTYCSAYIHGPWQKIDPEKDCEKCSQARYIGIPRSEAVERMAKAIYVDAWKRRTPLIRVTNWEYGFADNMKKKYRLAAEAALDALVGKK